MTAHPPTVEKMPYLPDVILTREMEPIHSLPLVTGTIQILSQMSSISFRSHGGTDMKITSLKLARQLTFIAQSGPTWDPLPPFRWSEQDFQDTPHVGHPDLWQFQPIIPKWA